MVRKLIIPATFHEFFKKIWIYIKFLENRVHGLGATVFTKVLI